MAKRAAKAAAAASTPTNESASTSATAGAAQSTADAGSSRFFQLNSDLAESLKPASGDWRNTKAVSTFSFFGGDANDESGGGAVDTAAADGAGSSEGELGGASAAYATAASGDTAENVSVPAINASFAANGAAPATTTLDAPWTSGARAAGGVVAAKHVVADDFFFTAEQLARSVRWMASPRCPPAPPPLCSLFPSGALHDSRPAFVRCRT